MIWCEVGAQITAFHDGTQPVKYGGSCYPWLAVRTVQMFWFMTPCSLTSSQLRFKRTFCPLLALLMTTFQTAGVSPEVRNV
jgi:hypothetical protein